jgi:hypothetical protein
MTRAQTLALLLVAGCSAAATPPTPTITTGALSWKIEQTEHSFRATGTAPVQISDEAHAYLVIYRVYWDAKLDPAASADTSIATAIVVPRVPGHQNVEIGDYSSRCTQYSGPECLRRAVDPVARLELVGWSRFERP